jgi:CDP-glycerol glycerophosphotransferase
VQLAPPGGLLWLNGDVVFTSAVLGELESALMSDQSFVAVNRSRVAEEEVKYTIDTEGFIDKLSKRVQGALGEAVGINYVSTTDRPSLARHLLAVSDNDYFERAIECAIETEGLRFLPLDISMHGCVEVDFAEDLEVANTL